MRPFIVALGILCAAIAGGGVFYWTHSSTSPVFPPVVVAPAPSPALPEAPAVEATATEKREAARILKNANDAQPTVAAAPALPEVKPDASTNASATVAHSRAVDTLVSAQTNFGDRQALLRQLKQLGELDSAIAELKRRTAENPNDAGIPTALGEAIMNKFPVQDFNEASALGLQIDQSFDAALRIDPANWEAQFYKADSMSYWPDVAGKGPEVIQRLSALIDQQERMPPQPQFAKTYALLGDQFQKAGQPDYAEQTWKLGLAKFPADATLLKRIGNPSP